MLFLHLYTQNSSENAKKCCKSYLHAPVTRKRPKNCEYTPLKSFNAIVLDSQTEVVALKELLDTTLRLKSCSNTSYARLIITS